MTFWPRRDTSTNQLSEGTIFLSKYVNNNTIRHFVNVILGNAIDDYDDLLIYYVLSFSNRYHKFL